jgi:hypothetical protein
LVSLLYFSVPAAASQNQIFQSILPEPVQVVKLSLKYTQNEYSTHRFKNIYQLHKVEGKMKTVVQKFQALLSHSYLFRIWQARAILIGVACATIAIIILLSFGEPNKIIATGGCTAPDGICNTSVNS